MNKKKIEAVAIAGTLAILVIAGVTTLPNFTSKELATVQEVNVSSPIEVTDIEVKEGTYTGTRVTAVDGQKQIENLTNLDTEKFHIYSYNSTTHVNGKKSDLWIENIKENTYSTQTLIVDSDTKEIVYVSPVLEPGTYVESQELLTSNIDTTKSYEVQTFMYMKDKETYNLYSAGVASLTFVQK